MNFTNYTEFRTKVLRMIDGDDVGAGSIAPDTLDLMIALGESRVYHGDGSTPGLRTRDMVAPLSVAITNNAANLPADCLELLRVRFTNDKPLVYMSEDDVLRQLDAGVSGQTYAYAQQGNSIIFLPAATGTIAGRYYQRPADLSAGLHSTFTRYPECFLFGALSEAAIFLGEDARLPLWKQLWAGWMESAARTEQNLVHSGGRLTVRAR